jgi:SP family galactose:H+ symporter-like MFS transporter
MLVAATFLTLTDNLGKAGTFWLFAAVCLAGMVYCYFYVPETKGLTLEQIEEHLHKGGNLRKLGSE